MQTSDHGFEQILSAVLEQKQVWEKLQAENYELHQQLGDLRAGRGILVEILNQRFELSTESFKAVPELMTVAPTKSGQSQTAKGTKGATQPPSRTTSGILEEMLLDELSSAMHNRRMGTHSEKNSSTAFNEEQKANLRRELSGSFLLE